MNPDWPEISKIRVCGTAPEIFVNGCFDFAAHRLFSDISITLLPASWTCLLGASGAGKSTLLRLIAGLETGGQFLGAVESDDGVDLSKRISYMSQSDLLLSWLTVRQNAALGHRLRGDKVNWDRVDYLLAKVGLADHANKKPRQLSGGMRQRTALVRTLMEDRPVVLLDEPFSALDSKNRTEIQELAFTVLKGRTVLLVTHDIPEAMRLGDQLYILKEQQVILYPLPAVKPLRQINAPEVLQQQAKLLAELN